VIPLRVGRAGGTKLHARFLLRLQAG